jgi:uncharacterized protein
MEGSTTRPTGGIYYLSRMGRGAAHMEPDFVIAERKDFEVKNAMLIDGFPSVGLVSAIASNFLIYQMNLEYVGSIQSRHLAPVAVVMDQRPMPPLRIYAGTPVCDTEGLCEQVVLVTSEFKVPDNFVRPLATSILDWARKKGIGMVVSMDAIPIEGDESPDQSVVGVGSTDKARATLDKFGVPLLKGGIIAGISGVLLYEGQDRGHDVACILSHANPNYPDARGAANLISVIDKILLKINLDASPLYSQAEVIEGQIKEMRKKALKGAASPALAEPAAPLYG